MFIQIYVDNHKPYNCTFTMMLTFTDKFPWDSQGKYVMLMVTPTATLPTRRPQPWLPISAYSRWRRAVHKTPMVHAAPPQRHCDVSSEKSYSDTEDEVSLDTVQVSLHIIFFLS